MFFIASIVGKVINAVAGGGGMITFPLLMMIVGIVFAASGHYFWKPVRLDHNACKWRVGGSSEVGGATPRSNRVSNISLRLGTSEVTKIETYIRKREFNYV